MATTIFLSRFGVIFSISPIWPKSIYVILLTSILLGGCTTPNLISHSITASHGHKNQGDDNRLSLSLKPLNGGRLSSGFGMRVHPVLKTKRLHRGIDYAAPKGTPVYASGAGRITAIGVYNGYGNYIRVKHAGGYETAYAHLDQFVKGLRAGQEVSQGDLIGYVGATGRATGPHLHFEVLANGAPIDPETLRARQPKQERILVALKAG